MSSADLLRIKLWRLQNVLQVDMIFMGTKGANTFLKKCLGTNAQKFMKKSACSVWIIPEKAPVHHPQHFLYAADFKKMNYW